MNPIHEKPFPEKREKAVSCASSGGWSGSWWKSSSNEEGRARPAMLCRLWAAILGSLWPRGWAGWEPAMLGRFATTMGGAFGFLMEILLE